ncbi:homoserine dehydrogenase [Parvularcula maris]|uniref:Homoserine dehydrogenase n=1 Tax=Parvularcula maris TaxID=2965077 RepID=A0A9X2RK55_9PROT|nr:homoserine dehydrogenase [Parvularcula maris]MCQ8185267.1 homoserine dehydrogenase [Parvularcula maris]
MALRVNIAGLGTVGASLLQLLEGGQREGLAVSGISARSRSRDRGVDLSPYAWSDDPVSLAQADDAEVFVELIGGEDGVAKAAIETALRSGKHVVTANKALIAKHGLALAQLAEEMGVALRFEAAVAGGVPVVSGLRTGLSGSKILRLQGVLNGTCNFILAAMEGGASYADALAEAQRLGFAEADPSFDVGGIDAAQKLAILAAHAFGAMPPLTAIDPRGIDQVTPGDLSAARELGLRMKLVAAVSRTDDGLAARVAPALVPITSALDIGGGSENIVVVDAEPLGRVAFSGPGAGGGPTASAVLSDLTAISRGALGPAFGHPASSIDAAPKVAPDASPVPHFIRVLVEDRPGVLAGLTDILGRAEISIETIRQGPASQGEPGVELVLTTHASSTETHERAAAEIGKLEAVLAKPSVYPILSKD